MKEKDIDILVSRYGDPDLSDSERARLDDLLARSPEAREALRQYERLDGALGQLPGIVDGVDQEAVFERIQQAVAAGAARPAGRGRLWVMRIAALVVLALLAGLALVSLWGPHMAGPGSLGEPGGEVARVQLSAEPVYALRPAVVVSLQEETAEQGEVSVTLAVETEAVSSAVGDTVEGEVLWCAAPPAKAERSNKAALRGEGGGLLAIFF